MKEVQDCASKIAPHPFAESDPCACALLSFWETINQEVFQRWMAATSNKKRTVKLDFAQKLWGKNILKSNAACSNSPVAYHFCL